MAKWLMGPQKFFHSLPLKKEPESSFDPDDPISRYAAEVERELAKEEQRTGLTAGTLVAMKFIGVYDDGREVILAAQPMNPTVLVPGASVHFDEIELVVK